MHAHYSPRTNRYRKNGSAHFHGIKMGEKVSGEKAALPAYLPIAAASKRRMAACCRITSLLLLLVAASRQEQGAEMNPNLLLADEELKRSPLAENPFFLRWITAKWTFTPGNEDLDPDEAAATCSWSGTLDCPEEFKPKCVGNGVVDCAQECPGEESAFEDMLDRMENGTEFLGKYSFFDWLRCQVLEDMCRMAKGEMEPNTIPWPLEGVVAGCRFENYLAVDYVGNCSKDGDHDGNEVSENCSWATGEKCRVVGMDCAEFPTVGQCTGIGMGRCALTRFEKVKNVLKSNPLASTTACVVVLGFVLAAARGKRALRFFRRNRQETSKASVKQENEQQVVYSVGTAWPPVPP